jgi:hypothetical protein
MEITLLVGASVEAIYADDAVELLKDLGNVSIRRASHVEPEEDGWYADMSPVGGPKLGPFSTRSRAIQSEVQWLQRNKDL